MNDILTSITRTGIPYVVGAIVAWLAQKGVHVSAASVASATAWFTFLFGSVYYIAVRWLETKFPKLGWLLGVPVKPTYPEAE